MPPFVPSHELVMVSIMTGLLFLLGGYIFRESICGYWKL